MQAILLQSTVGLDLGDKSSWMCVLDQAAPIVEEVRIPVTPEAVRRRFSEMGRSRVALARASLTTFSFAVYQLNADGRLARSSTINGSIPANRSSLTRIGGRHLAWSMARRPNGRSLVLDVPGSAGQPHVVGLSLRGWRPGPLLPDGREVPLAPDGLTWLTLQGGVRGVLENTVGFLDASGRADIKVDANTLGGLVRDTKVWAAAVVLDAKASAGVRAILGPSILALK